jgi:tetratricopeptide (TPR) repeat protein
MVEFRVLPGLAEVYEMTGETQHAFACLDRWFAVRNKLGLDVGDSFYYRVRGKLFFKAGSDDEAESNFRKSIEFAAGRSAKSEELRSAVGLARLLKQQSRRAEARPMLAEIYNWFAEGFDTADLKDAKNLLDELGTGTAPT